MPKKSEYDYWTTKDGKELEIKNMTDSHVLNTYNYILKHPTFLLEPIGNGLDLDDIIFDVDDEMRNKYIQRFEKEIKRRKLK